MQILPTLFWLCHSKTVTLIGDPFYQLMSNFAWQEDRAIISKAYFNSTFLQLQKLNLGRIRCSVYCVKH